MNSTDGCQASQGLRSWCWQAPRELELPAVLGGLGRTGLSSCLTWEGKMIFLYLSWKRIGLLFQIVLSLLGFFAFHLWFWCSSTSTQQLQESIESLSCKNVGVEECNSSQMARWRFRERQLDVAMKEVSSSGGTTARSSGPSSSSCRSRPHLFSRAGLFPKAGKCFRLTLPRAMSRYLAVSADTVLCNCLLNISACGLNETGPNKHPQVCTTAFLLSVFPY